MLDNIEGKVLRQSVQWVLRIMMLKPLLKNTEIKKVSGEVYLVQEDLLFLLLVVKGNSMDRHFDINF